MGSSQSVQACSSTGLYRLSPALLLCCSWLSGNLVRLCRCHGAVDLVRRLEGVHNEAILLHLQHSIHAQLDTAQRTA